VTGRSNAVAGGLVAHAVRNADVQHNKKKCLAERIARLRCVAVCFCSVCNCTLFPLVVQAFRNGSADASAALPRNPF
jgi:hypothetical protein